eukprot:COSAG02_NODE_31591_length_531_cov_0.599537_1_plen_34_part_10
MPTASMDTREVGKVSRILYVASKVASDNMLARQL